MPRNNADFHGITFRYERDSEGDHNIIAEHPSEDEPVGFLTWANRDYEEGAKRGHIMDVHVVPEYRRKGIASGMFAEAIKHSKINGLPTPVHAETRTESGDAWSKSVGDYYPPKEITNY